MQTSDSDATAWLGVSVATVWLGVSVATVWLGVSVFQLPLRGPVFQLRLRRSVALRARNALAACSGYELREAYMAWPECNEGNFGS